MNINPEVKKAIVDFASNPILKECQLKWIQAFEKELSNPEGFNHETMFTNFVEMCVSMTRLQKKLHDAVSDSADDMFVAYSAMTTLSEEVFDDEEIKQAIRTVKKMKEELVEAAKGIPGGVLEMDKYMLTQGRVDEAVNLVADILHAETYGLDSPV